VYKIYTGILNARLVKFSEENNLIADEKMVSGQIGAAQIIYSQ